jgi:pimeloyl-ACP methyl ester carboxylesterase
LSAIPETKYAKTEEGVYIAYQTMGDGPRDLLLCLGAISHVEVWWENARLASWLHKLSSFSRLILFDKRGVGLSDRVAPSEVPSLERWMDDVRAVLDACGSERPALLGWAHGGLMAMLFAATHPERTASLVRRVESEWGATGWLLDMHSPTSAGDSSDREWECRM